MNNIHVQAYLYKLQKSGEGELTIAALALKIPQSLAVTTSR
jgi:hypothetical protein